MLPRLDFPIKATLTAVTLAAMLASLKAWDWRSAAELIDFQPREIHLAPTEDQIKDYTALRTKNRGPRRGTIIDASESMTAFYTALLATEQRRGVTRVVHYGESPTTADLITADVRSLLQSRFGDAGHGFALVAKPWAWYQHRGVEVRGDNWRIHPAHQGALKDGKFGLGGVTFLGATGSASRIKVQDRHHTGIEISYLAQPSGGSFTLFADGQPLGTIDTNADTEGPGYASFKAPDGVGEFEVGGVKGPVRLFGVRLAKTQPGVMYDSLGLNGASIMVPSRQFNEAHWADQLRHANPHLVVLNYGINESVFAQFVDKGLEAEIRRVIARIRKAVPEASILLMAPMDRGDRNGKGEIVTPPALERVVEIQSKVAADTGCAFFNTFEAMGGRGTMAKWYTETPRLVGADLLHPLPSGAKKVGELFYKGLIDGYMQFKLARLAKGRPIASTDAQNKQSTKR